MICLEKLYKIAFFILLSVGLHLAFVFADFIDLSVRPELRPVGKTVISLAQRARTDFRVEKPRMPILNKPLQESKHSEIVKQVLRESQTQKNAQLISSAKSGVESVAVQKSKRVERAEKPIYSADTVNKSNNTVRVVSRDSLPSRSVLVETNEEKESGFISESGEVTDFGSSTPVKVSQNAVARYDVNPPPKYPERARRLKHEGRVLLDLFLSTDGQVDKISLARSSGYKSLDRAALKTVKYWLFQPALSYGIPVKSRVIIPVDFVLSSK